MSSLVVHTSANRHSFLLAPGYQISKDETVTSDDLSNAHSNIMPEYGGSIHEGMKFSILAAGVDLWRKVGQQLLIELPAHELR